MTDEGVPGMGPRWWERHRSLATLAAAAVALTVAALVLAGHAITVAESTHRLEGDAAYFGVIATLIVLGAGVVIARQRRS